MNVELLAPEAEPEYAQYVEEAPERLAYHLLAWRDILRDVYRYEPRYLIARDDSGALCGALPLFLIHTLVGGRRLVSLPFSHLVPMLGAQDAQVAQALVEAALEMARRERCRFLRLKHGAPLPDSCGLRAVEEVFNSPLDIARPLEEVRAGFHKKSVGWSIRRAMRSDLTVVEGDQTDDYRAFFNLELETRKRQGSPPYAFAFFRRLCTDLAPQGVSRLWLVKLRGQAVAGVICLNYGETAIYGYAASVSDREVLRLRPNNLAVWTGIQTAHEAGMKCFDFGITRPSEQGLLKFKSRWGAEDTKPIYHYALLRTKHVPSMDQDSFAVRAASAVLKRLPLPILRAVGPPLLRQLG